MDGESASAADGDIRGLGGQLAGAIRLAVDGQAVAGTQLDALTGVQGAAIRQDQMYVAADGDAVGDCNSGSLVYHIPGGGTGGTPGAAAVFCQHRGRVLGIYPRLGRRVVVAVGHELLAAIGAGAVKCAVTVDGAADVDGAVVGQRTVVGERAVHRQGHPTRNGEAVPAGNGHSNVFRNGNIHGKYQGVAVDCIGGTIFADARTAISVARCSAPAADVSSAGIPVAALNLGSPRSQYKDRSTGFSNTNIAGVTANARAGIANRIIASLDGQFDRALNEQRRTVRKMYTRGARVAVTCRYFHFARALDG